MSKAKRIAKKARRITSNNQKKRARYAAQKGRLKGDK
jgi:hypothetical protein